MEALGIQPSRVTFFDGAGDGDGLVTLIYSIALPAPLADPDAPDAGLWIPLLEFGGSQAEGSKLGSQLLRQDDPFAKIAVEYWREELEEETQLFAFLPRYFTARQARDVYSAFWGYQQDPNRFSTWSGIGVNKKNGSYSDYIEEAGDLNRSDLLDAQVDAVMAADATQALGNRFAASLLCDKFRASDRAVGLWPSSSAAASTPVEALPAIQVAASLVAYERPSRGPKPTWYKRTAERPTDRRLTEIYAPRAVWMFDPRP